MLSVTTWDWERDPTALRQWQDLDQKALITDGLLAEAPKAGTARLRATTELALSLSRTTVIHVEDRETLIRAAQFAPLGPLRIPALRVERQAELLGRPGEAPCGPRALVRVPARHRALVLSPRERLDVRRVLGDWYEPNGRPTRGIDLVVVRGVVGPGAWPLHPSWVREVRDQCTEAETAFAFAGWGSWCPTSQLPPGSYATPASVLYLGDEGHAVLFDDGAHGADISGRLLDGQEYLLGLPE